MTRPPAPPPPPYEPYGGARATVVWFDELAGLERWARANKALSWVGTALQVIGVFLMSGRLAPAPVAFAVMLAGSVAWSAAAWRRREWSMLTLNLVFCLSNLMGMWRWAA